MEKVEKRILLDSDVIVHLFKAEQLSLLQQLYPNRILLLDIVYEELLKNPTIRAHVQNLIIFKQVRLFIFPVGDSEILKEYNHLKQSKGKGESACMAVCRHKKNILASSNLKDIKSYCAQYDIEYLTTMDLLAISYIKEVISAADADLAIYNVKSKGSKLPNYDKIEEYIANEFDKKKLTY